MVESDLSHNGVRTLGANGRPDMLSRVVFKSSKKPFLSLGTMPTGVKHFYLAMVLGLWTIVTETLSTTTWFTCYG